MSVKLRQENILNTPLQSPQKCVILKETEKLARVSLAQSIKNKEFPGN